MRSRFLCAFVLLCGADVANAQQWPSSASPGYYPPQFAPGYQSGYQPGYQAAPQAYGYYGQGQAPNQQGYYPYNTGNYPNNAAAYPTYPTYPTAAQGSDSSASLPPSPAQAASPVQEAPAAATAMPGVAMTPGANIFDPAQGPPLACDGGSCGGDCCQPREPEKPKAEVGKDHMWIGADYVLSFLRPQHLPGPLATTGSISDPRPGALGQPGTGVLFGDNIDFTSYSGVKLECGFYLDADNHFGVDFAGMYLFPNRINFMRGSDAGGNPIITRPVTNANTGQEIAYLDSFPSTTIGGATNPGIAAGNIDIAARSEFWSGEVNGSYNFFPGEHFRGEIMIGARYLRLAESLAIQDQFSPLSNNVLTFNGAPVNAGSSLVDLDRFRTTNQFYGLQIGGAINWDSEWFFVNAYAKCAFGAIDEQVDINGASTLSTPTGNTTTTGGLLALPSNIGHYDRTVFGITPEVGLNVGVNITRHLCLTAGYSFLYWNQVVRPAGQIDRTVNPTQVPTDNSFGGASGMGGAARPAFAFNDDYLWLHTLTIGFVVHY